MTRNAMAALLAVFVLTGTSEARPLKRVTDYQSVQIIPHPAGCPRIAFCGCGASSDLFGSPRRSLFLAANWLKFPRTNPAPNMAAARRGHVFVLKRHIQGNVWLAADYNSGNHQSRLHPRSIAGYTIVNPFSHMAAANHGEKYER